MVLTMRIICLVGKINMPLPTSKEVHECGVILMVGAGREQFERFLCLLEIRQKDGLVINVKTPEDILSYLNSCVK